MQESNGSPYYAALIRTTVYPIYLPYFVAYASHGALAETLKGLMWLISICNKSELGLRKNQCLNDIQFDNYEAGPFQLQSHQG